MNGTRSWRHVLSSATEVLGSAGDARWLVCQAGGFTPAELLVALDEPVPGRAGTWLTVMVDRRLGGAPLQYALGRWGFRRLDLMVDRRVLIPRAETEQVVEAALAEGRRIAVARPAGHPLVAVDLGTGSGAIALSLAVELPRAQVWATEASAEAIEVASANLCGLAGQAATRVRIVQGSWFDPLPAELRGRLDLVVSNPPYIADDETLPAEVVDWEPAVALRAGPTGIECLAEIVAAAPSWLAADGVLVVEVAPGQAAEIAALARSSGFSSVDVGRDLAGRERMVVARRAVP